MIASMENQRLIMLSGEFDAKAEEKEGKREKALRLNAPAFAIFH